MGNDRILWSDLRFHDYRYIMDVARTDLDRKILRFLSETPQGKKAQRAIRKGAPCVLVRKTFKTDVGGVDVRQTLSYLVSERKTPVMLSTSFMLARDKGTMLPAAVFVKKLCSLAVSPHALIRFSERAMRDGPARLGDDRLLESVAFSLSVCESWIGKGVYGESGRNPLCYNMSPDGLFIGYALEGDRSTMRCETFISPDMFHGQAEYEGRCGRVSESLSRYLSHGLAGTSVEEHDEMDRMKASFERYAMPAFTDKEARAFHERNKRHRVNRLARMSGSRWNGSGYVSRDDGRGP